MNKSKTVTLIAILLLTFAGNIYAQDSYFGGSIGIIDYSEEGISDDASLTALLGRLGTSFNENFSGEIRVGVGLGDDSVNVLGTSVDVELDNMFGAYVRGGVAASESFFPYVVLGYTRGEVTASVPGFNISESESDVSFGIGADFNMSGNVVLNVEYISYLDKEGVEVEGFSIGFASQF